MKPKILFVCTVNRMRSRTAQHLFEQDERLEVKSAGTSSSATIRVDEVLLEWADFILVMEKAHRNVIRKHFPRIYREKPIICLYIPDEYHFMQVELIALLKTRFESIYQTEIAPRLPS